MRLCLRLLRPSRLCLWNSTSHTDLFANGRVVRSLQPHPRGSLSRSDHKRRSCCIRCNSERLTVGFLLVSHLRLHDRSHHQDLGFENSRPTFHVRRISTHYSHCDTRRCRSVCRFVLCSISLQLALPVSLRPRRPVQFATDRYSHCSPYRFSRDKRRTDPSLPLYRFCPLNVGIRCGSSRGLLAYRV